MRHLNHFLGKYDKYMIIPESLKVNYAGFKNKRFSNRFFGSVEAHRKLMLSAAFYESFKKYKYILTYHLDSLVFSDQLLEWCGTDLDYIGAPWIYDENWPNAIPPDNIGKVGNSGFCLRKISSCLKVINSSRYSIDPAKYSSNLLASKSAYQRFLNQFKKLLKYLKVFNNARWEMSRYRRNDDIFWAHRAIHYYPEFKIAPLETTLRFAFECAPRKCFELTNHILPFGCHAWQKYDRQFWEPYLLK